jgi:hypothetical protein
MRKHWIVFAFAFVFVAGCGATIKDLRRTPPQSKTVAKEASCVFARLQHAAMEEQTCDICAQLVWTGNWDPTVSEGVVYAHVTYYEYWPIMFTVRAEGPATVVEKRVPKHHLSRYREIADRIYEASDFSRCPDLPAS